MISFSFSRIKGVYLKMLSTNLWTPIRKAIVKDDLEDFRLLVEKCANINSINDMICWSPLTKVIDCGKIEFARPRKLEELSTANLQDMTYHFKLFIHHLRLSACSCGVPYYARSGAVGLWVGRTV